MLLVLTLCAAATGTLYTDNCTNSFDIRSGFNFGARDVAHGGAANANACAERCCNTTACVSWTYSSFQPAPTPSCAQGSKCCWLKASGGDFNKRCANCTSGKGATKPTPIPAPTPGPTPSPYLFPSLTYVKTIANASTGNLRDPSSVVQDPKTGQWHFYVDYMDGPTQPGWHSYQHHYSSDDIEGPWTNHGIAPGLNHSTDPKAWDYAGMFSPSLIYVPDEDIWYIFYSASGANQSELKTSAQMVTLPTSPHSSHLLRPPPTYSAHLSSLLPPTPYSSHLLPTPIVR
jgi:hypothetical protein